MADDNANLNINIGGNPAGVEQASRRGSAAIKGVQSEAKALDAAFRALKSSIDPTFQAQERYNQSLDNNRKLLAAGRISGQEFAAGMRIAAAALNEARTAAEQNSASYREQQAASRAAAAQEAADAKAAALAVKAAAAEKAAAEKAAAAEASAAKRAAAAAEREAVREAAAAVKAAARQKATDEKAASAEAAAQVKADKAAEKAAVRDAAAVTKQAEKDKRDAIRASNTASKEAADATRRQAIEARALQNAENELRASIDPAYASQLRYNQTMATATSLLMQNRLQQGEWNRIQKQAATQMEINTRQLGLQNTGYIQLGYQMQDITASVASGINPLVILAQQGGQTASAMAQMGEIGSDFASFMAGPWGAAILGAILALGILIPKMFDWETSAERAKTAEEHLRGAVDATTGAIDRETDAIHRRILAREQDKLSTDQAANADNAKRGALYAADRSTSTTTSAASTSFMNGLPKKADIGNPESAAAVQRWSALVKAGSISVQDMANNIANLGKTDKDVAKLSEQFDKLAGVTSDGDKTAATAQARAKQLRGQDLTDAERHLLGIKTMNEQLSTSYLNAAATYAVTTDAVDKARAAQTMGEERADLARKEEIARTGDAAEANRKYQSTVAPLIAATEAAQTAKTAASKAASTERRQERKDETEAKRAEEEALKFRIESLDYEREKATDDYGEQHRLLELKIDELRKFYGDSSKEVVRGQRELEKLEQKHRDEILRIDRDRIKAQSELDVARVEAQRSVAANKGGEVEDTVTTAGSTGLLAGRPLIEARREVLAEQYRMEVDFEAKIFQLKAQALRDEIALLREKPVQQAELNGQLLVLEAAHENAMKVMASANSRSVNKLNLDVVENSVSKWKTATDSIGSSLNSMFQGMWNHSQTFGQGMLGLADNLVFKYVDAGLKIATDWAANELSKTAATLIGHSIRTGAAATAAVATTGIEAAAATTQIAARGAVAAAGAYSSTVVIPFIGPVAAPIAAAVALAAVLGFGALISAKGGMGEVPSDQLAMVHKKEMILPAWIAEPMRNSLRNPRTSGPAVGSAYISGAAARSATHHNSSSPTFNYSPTTTIGDTSMETMLRRDGNVFRKWIRNEVRNNRLDI